MNILAAPLSEQVKKHREYLDAIFGWPFNIPTVSRQFGMSDVFDSIAENEDGTASLSIDVPGMKAADIEISVDKNIITVKGQRNDNRRQNTLNTSFTLPAGYNPDSVIAHLEDGVMTLSFSKLPPERSEVKKITIQSVSPTQIDQSSTIEH